MEYTVKLSEKAFMRLYGYVMNELTNYEYRETLQPCEFWERQVDLYEQMRKQFKSALDEVKQQKSEVL